MHKIGLLIIIYFSFANSLFGQNSVLSREKKVINESLTLIDKSDLFQGWKNYKVDTTNPTSVKEDLNGDGKIDLAGFYTGIEDGFFVFGNMIKVNGPIQRLYKLPFDSTWFDQDKFQAVLTLVKSGQKVKNSETGSFETLKYNSIQIYKKDGQKFIVTLDDNGWRIIKNK